MSDPWEQQPADGIDDSPPAYRPAYTAPPPRDNTPYIILMGVGCAFALAVVIYAISTSRPAGDAPGPPPPARAAQHAPAQQLPQGHAVPSGAGASGAAQGPPRAATMPARPAARQDEAWTIEKAVQIAGAIDEQGRLRITARNASPGRIRHVNVEVRTSDRENANRTVTISDIGPGQETTVVVDYPELRRRDDPRAVPEMYV